MKTKLLRLLFVPLCLCGALLLQSGCASNSGLNRVPVLREIVPDLTNPDELREIAELAGVLVLSNNPDDVEDLRAAVTAAELALGGTVITQEQFDRWVGRLLAKIEEPAVRVFVRQRFERAWKANGDLLNVSGLQLGNVKHRELAEAFIGGLRSAVDEFATAQTIAAPAATPPTLV